MNKRCPRCMRLNPTCGFSRDRRAKSGFVSHCKDCRRKRDNARVVHPLHATWVQMRQRCNNPRNKRYAAYGGRGINVCARWSVFEHFVADMGPRPSPTHSLDRINNDGNYEPANVRWATKVEQQRHRTDTKYLTFRGETLAQVEWAERLGISQFTIYRRLKAGWSLERALTTPIHRRVA